jgi:hypothetical protein
MGERRLALANVNRTVKGFIIDSINDVADERWFEISLPDMRQSLTTVDLEISIRNIAGKPFVFVHAVRKNGKASALDSDGNVMMINSYIIAGADLGKEEYMIRSLTDDEVCHIKDNLVLMYMRENDGGYNFIAVTNVSPPMM